MRQSPAPTANSPLPYASTSPSHEPTTPGAIAHAEAGGDVERADDRDRVADFRAHAAAAVQRQREPGDVVAVVARDADADAAVRERPELALRGEQPAHHRDQLERLAVGEPVVAD